MLHRLDCQIVIDVSEDRDAFIFRVSSPKRDNSSNRDVLMNCILLKNEIDRERWRKKEREKGTGKGR
jgi:hypothetical protein